MKFNSILLDLDGTLVDSAPDLAFALNQTLLKNNKTQKNFIDIRKLVSKGGKELIKFGFEIDELEPNFKIYHQQLLNIYKENIAKYSTLFIDIDFLNGFEKWGIVTNKPTELTHILLDKFNLKPDIVVCGDSLANNKPHPEPVLFALQKMIGATVFVGDDIVDIQAGKSAGLKTIAVNYGYGIPNKNWDYDFLVDSPKDLYQFGKIQTS